MLTVDTNDLMMDYFSYFNLMRKNQVNLLLSSTTIKKYLYPIMGGMDRGSQISICTKSKTKLENWELIEIKSLFSSHKNKFHKEKYD